MSETSSRSTQIGSRRQTHSQRQPCRHGKNGCKASGKHNTAMAFKTWFRQRTEEGSGAAADIRGCVLRLGGEPEGSGNARGAMHRGWVAVGGTLSGYRDPAIRVESERREDPAPARRRKARKTRLPSDLEPLVQRLKTTPSKAATRSRHCAMRTVLALKPKARRRCRSADAAAGAGARGEGQRD
ncbi:MAG: PA2169 family four-helix-bundle protein [Rhodoferax sp.]|nr:PA2169 family four-helix-bundle protein [Rhodoferax sp.]